MDLTRIPLKILHESTLKTCPGFISVVVPLKQMIQAYISFILFSWVLTRSDEKTLIIENFGSPVEDLAIDGSVVL